MYEVTYAPARPLLRGGLGLAAGFLGGAVATVAAGVSGVGGLFLPIIAVAVIAALTTMIEAIVAAVFCWAFYAGFVLGRAGDLAVDDRAQSGLVALLAVAVLSCGIAAVARKFRSPYRIQPNPVTVFAGGVKGVRNGETPEVNGDGYVRP